MKLPRPTLKERIKRYYSCGQFAGIILLFIVILDIFFYIFLSFVQPVDKIEKAIEFPNKKYNENKEKYGDH